MRGRHTHHVFASLALVAMLLLSVLPTLGRLADHGTTPEAHGRGMLSDVHTAGMDHAGSMAHMSHEGNARHLQASTPVRPAPHDGHGDHDGHDCPYCPLLAGLASCHAPPGLPAAGVAATVAVSVRLATHPSELRTSSLGSRGPPTLEG